MIKPILQDSYDPIDSADILQFERMIGVQLPNHYRTFVLARNGGDFPAEVGVFDKQGEFVTFCAFYGMATNDFNDILDAYQSQESNLKERVVPIGIDSLGNQLGIVVSGHEVGAVLFFDHENSSVRWPPENAIWLADNFAAFLDSILYSPDYDWNENTPPFLAAEMGDTEKLRSFLNEGLPIESRNDEGSTLLSCASSARQSQVVGLLLKLDAQVDSRNNFGQTALFAAANSHSLDSAKLLVEGGADVNATDIDGDTPLLVGMGFGYRVPLYLISHGADVNIRNKNGQGALDLCNNYVEYLRDPLIRAGAHL